MDPIITDNNVVNISNLDTSISELEKFIEAQHSALCRIQLETESLEELKRQAVAQPEVVLGEILAGEHDALKFSNGALGLAVNIPEIDWTLLEVNDVSPVAHRSQSEIGSSHLRKMKKDISDFRQALSQLPPLPAELQDDDTARDADERGKKRRRIGAASRVPTATTSSGLRLPGCNSDLRTEPFSSARIPRLPEGGYPATSNSSGIGGQSPTKPDQVPRDHVEISYLPQRPWASKGVNGDTSVRHKSPSPTSPTSQDVLPSPTQPVENLSVAFTAEKPTVELPDAGDAHSTFKQNWTLAEQHTLERLLVEIPSTVKFRWVRISEAMGGTRTPRQVASRVQKYYEKMKKLGVTVNSADMGGGGRGGSKATETLDTPPTMRTRGPSSRGKPKTGPQYTKSGRRR